MLVGLDQIPWSTLKHAYGDAGDIPNIIRKLLSNDPDERAWAQGMLEMGPFHQESIYTCTPFVIRFLMQIAEEDDAPDKPWMLQYVSSVLAVAFYHLWGSDTSVLDSEGTIAEQIVSEIRAYLPSLLSFLDSTDIHVRLAILRLLVLLKADFPHLDDILAEKLVAETEESIRGALAFCLALLADSSPMAPIVAMLENIAENLLVRIAAGFGIIAQSGEDIPDNTVSDFCAVIANNYDALDRFEEVYAEYLTPLGAPRGQDRLLECLHDNLSAPQKDQIARALLTIYARLPTASYTGIRIGSGYYLEAMVRLGFPQGKLPPTTTIRDLSDIQRDILEAFQKYDMPAITWNVYGPNDYRKVLGFDFKSETDFLDFMAGKRPAKWTQ